MSLSDSETDILETLAMASRMEALPEIASNEASDPNSIRSTPKKLHAISSSREIHLYWTTITFTGRVASQQNVTQGAVDNVARWDGQQLQPVGSGADRRINALASWELNSSPMLIAGGRFNQAGELPIANLAAWDGQQWEDLEVGATSSSAAVEALFSAPEQDSPLYVGGSFSRVGNNLPAIHMARWRACPYIIFSDGSRVAGSQ
ncbi:MAG: hypothetical protein EA370_03655 [Wenzhouxiangella sp.]|nr:MAG: hypothetical protein EA370_03655 [Wenzhouxiangella sp.]